MATLTIGRMSTATGVKVETIRYYERSGLIAPPERTGGNYRAYTQGDLERLRFVRRTRDLGFSLEEIRTMLDLSGQRDQSCASVDAIASRHLADVDRKIADLQSLRHELGKIISNCVGGTVGDCRILGAFGEDGVSGH